MFAVVAIVAWIAASTAWWLGALDPLRNRAIGFGLALTWAALVLLAVSLEPRMFVSESTWRHDSYLRHIRVFIEVGLPWALVPWSIAVAVRFAIRAIARL